MLDILTETRCYSVTLTQTFNFWAFSLGPKYNTLVFILLGLSVTILIKGRQTSFEVERHNSHLLTKLRQFVYV